MRYSDLSQQLLRCAGADSAVGVLWAAATFCARDYRGLTPYRDPYEEDRLRLLFKKLYKGSPNLIATVLKKHLAATGPALPADKLEQLLTARGQALLTADILLLVAVDELPPQLRSGLYPQYRTFLPLQELLADIDREIYDFVIDQISQLQRRLQAKADDAQARRDWRPAAKPMEPETLLARFFQPIQVAKTDTQLELTVPGFWNGRPLTFTICSIGGIFYVHDGGWATGEPYVRGFCQSFVFMAYLQDLIALANSDLTGPMDLSPSETVDWAQAEPLDADGLLSQLKGCFLASYNEDRGLIFTARLGRTFAFLIEVTGDGLRIRDAKKDREGQIMEAFYLGNDELAPYVNFLHPYLQRFGGEYAENEIFLPVNDLIPGLYRALGLAALLSELGGQIPVPESN